MAKRITNASRVMDAFFYGTFYGKKGDKLWFNDNQIYDTNTLLGYFIDQWDNVKDESSHFLVLTIRNYKSQPNWKSHKKQLIREAREQCLPVIFVPDIDIGFGIEPYKINMLTDEYFNLLDILKFNTHERISAAALIIDDEVIAYTFGQVVDEEYMSAEDILCKYIRIVDEELDNEYTILSWTQPDGKTTMNMVKHNVIKMYYANILEAPSGNDIQVVNDIMSKYILSLNKCKPIKYGRLISQRVIKYLEKKKENK